MEIFRSDVSKVTNMGLCFVKVDLIYRVFCGSKFDKDLSGWNNMG